MFCAETNCSFQAMEKIDIILSSLSKNNRLPVKIKSRKVISRNVSNSAKNIIEDIFGIVFYLKKNTFSFSFTTDMWTNSKQESFMSLSLHVLTEDGILLKLVPFVSVFKERHTGKNIWFKLLILILPFVNHYSMKYNDIKIHRIANLVESRPPQDPLL